MKVFFSKYNYQFESLVALMFDFIFNSVLKSNSQNVFYNLVQRVLVLYHILIPLTIIHIFALLHT